MEKKKAPTDSFYQLDPNLVLESTEAAGFHPTGEFTQLNSYENRVFDLHLEDHAGMPQRVIAKFYRPGRWTKEAIFEEHSFLQELQDEGLTVAPAIKQKNHLPGMPTLTERNGLFCAFFQRVQGRLPQEFQLPDLQALGRKLALLHNVGGRSEFRHRPVLAENPYHPWETLEFLLPWVDAGVRSRYDSAAEQLLERLQDEVDPGCFQRIHGDAHRGNVLHNGKIGAESEFYFVDFDDSMMGPVAQDIWMLLSESESSAEGSVELEQLLIGYESLRKFPREQLEWLPLLRGLRIINYAAWIAHRWKDPAFPRLFPQFNSYNYWAEEVEALEKLLWTGNAQR